MQEEFFTMPAYLRDGEAAPAHVYGTLSYNRRSKCWTIKAEPCVTELAKRLFPGCDGRGRGVARFTAHRRVVGDLNWLMLRYPLEIKESDRPRWESALEEAREYAARRQAAMHAPQSATPPEGSFSGQLKEFQKEGLAYLLSGRRCLLADEMGLGKTVQALAFLASTASYPAVIVAPPHLVRNWTREIERFLNGTIEPKKTGAEPADGPRAQVGKSFTDSSDSFTDPAPGPRAHANAAADAHAGDPAAGPRAHANAAADARAGAIKDTAPGPRVHVIKGLTPYPLPDAEVYIIHYLLLRGWKDVLPELGFQTVVFDEIQELRRAGTSKYSAASLLSTACTNVVGLSGTPIYNTGGEIWNVVNILDFHFLGDWESFTREWCYGYNTNVVQKPELLGEYLRREGIMLRRLKRDVLSQLPPKRCLVQEIDWDDSVYRSMMLPAMDMLRQLRFETDESRRAILEDQVCQRERQATGLAKAPYVAAFVRSLVEGGEKVLLFAHHHAVMDLYKQELKSLHPVFITGRENDKQKDAALNKFMTGGTDLCVISLRSASGLNLQRASCVVFGELDWSPAVHSQAEDRAHRIGQQDSIACYYLVSPKGSDRDMQDALGLKVSQFVEMMGDNIGREDDSFLMESEARERVKKLVSRLMEE
ncbi:MAG: DEAD/DEAH box helicase [Clostridia bacterium]|nr:DEAD/DEAH box helicase [Clostridia bacterium]